MKSENVFSSTSARDALIAHWRRYSPIDPSVQIHQKDEISQGMLSGITTQSVDEYLEAKNRAKIHASLHPVPYLGDLKTASIYLFMINPSVELADYGTQSKPEFIDRLRDDLNQIGKPCLALDRRFWWTSWFSYYNRLFRPTFQKLINGERSYGDVLDCAAKHVAILELVPYFSEEASSVDPIAKDLLSASLARAAAKEICQQSKISDGKTLIIVRWSDKKKPTERWNLGRDAEGKHIEHSKARNGLSSASREKIELKLLELLTNQ